MKTALFDVNVLVALMWPEHQHHAAAHAWSLNRGQSRWATCPLTELGFIRLIMNPAFSRKAVPFQHAFALLRQAVSDSRHDFWSDRVAVVDAMEVFAPRVQGHGQLTDAYLLCVAKQHKGALATFDDGIRSIAVPEYASALEIIPTA